jgi:RNA polymerase sigma-70 factor (ECF subfamily)
MHQNNGDITQRLQRWSTGNRADENELFDAVFPNLKRLARYLMKRERSGHPLEPTELVNQIYFPLAAARKRIWQNRQHFFAVAARAMRRYLIDYARARGNVQFVKFEEGGDGDGISGDSTNLELLVCIGCLLDQLADTNPEWFMLVKLKYFVGLTDEEAAETLGIKLRTMQRMWAGARQWLFDRTGYRVSTKSRSLTGVCRVHFGAQ